MFEFDKQSDSIVVTGGSGFLGRHVIDELLSRGYRNIYSFSKNGRAVEGATPIKIDLRSKNEVRKIFYTNMRIEGIKAVINLAASVGGIGANQVFPATFMMDSLLIGSNLIDACLHTKSMQKGGKFVQIGTVCAYPKFCPTPFKEDSLWDGYPEETNAPYGIAKKAIMELIRACNNEHSKKFNGINLIPVNLYGPGDNFDEHSSHVIPALIRKFVEAKQTGLGKVEIWGTGNATREFLYVKDAAYGIVEALEKYEGSDPVNLGTGQDIKIKDLVDLIKELTEYNGEVVYNTSKPDGQPKRQLDVSRAFERFGFKAKTQFDEGLKETIKYFEDHYAS